MNKVILGAHGSYNPSRIKRFVQAKEKSNAIYMGVWDKFKDMFRNGEAKKIRQLENLWDKLYKFDDHSFKDQIDTFNKMEEITNDGVKLENRTNFSIKKELITTGRNESICYYFRINNQTIFKTKNKELSSLSFDKSGVHEIKVIPFITSNLVGAALNIPAGYKLDLSGKIRCIVKNDRYHEMIIYKGFQKQYGDLSLERYDYRNVHAELIHYLVNKMDNGHFQLIEIKHGRSHGMKPNKTILGSGDMGQAYKNSNSNLNARKIDTDEILCKEIINNYNKVIKYFSHCNKMVLKLKPNISGDQIILPTFKNTQKDLNNENAKIKEVMQYVSGRKVERLDSKKLISRMFQLTFIGHECDLFFLDNKYSNWIYDEKSDKLSRIDLTFDAVCSINLDMVCGTISGKFGVLNKNELLKLTDKKDDIDKEKSYPYTQIASQIVGSKPLLYDWIILKKIQALVELTISFIDINELLKDHNQKNLTKILVELLPDFSNITPKIDRDVFINMVVAWSLIPPGFESSIQTYMSKYMDWDPNSNGHISLLQSLHNPFFE